ncbi:MAG: DNA-binding protein [Gammaproteobacteria bacterium]|nr:DNA-binding protein [Gammaproteobacteria bacterium]
MLKKTAKDPNAVAIGQRLQQARRMAQLTSIDKLISKARGWEQRRSTLTNYEAGISLAPPEVALLYQEITACSACWIYFGSGPIRTVGRDLQAIRHQNLSALYHSAQQHKKIPALCKQLGVSRKTLAEHLHNPFLAISARLTRRAEHYAGKRPGYMDEQHIELDPICASFPDDMQRIMEIYSNLEPTRRGLLLKIAEAMQI